jgi:hypothetical protein
VRSISRLFGRRRTALPPRAGPARPPVGRPSDDARASAGRGRGLVSDRAATARRRGALEDYFAREVLAEGEFVCRHATSCRAAAESRGAGAYHEGQLSYLGPDYDLAEDGVPLRVLVAPMDTGHPPPRVSMAERSEQVARSQRSGYRGRNQHMKGTTLALRLAFGRAITDEREHLDIAGRRVPLFDAFAMANLLLCSAVDPEVAKKSIGMSIRTMRDNCLPHLMETMRILEPTLVIVQGVGVGRALGSALVVRRSLTEQVAEAELDGRRFAQVSLRHPSRNWFSPSQAYTVEVASPALTLGRELALSLAAA